MDAEKLKPQRKQGLLGRVAHALPGVGANGRDIRDASRAHILDEVWPVRSVAAWPKDLSLRREDRYADDGTGGSSR